MTMVEMISVITITAILVAAVLSFMRRPLEGYIDAAAHAQLVGAADLAMRRIARDLHTALPNSVQVGTVATAGDTLEYLEVVTGGRFRADPTVPSPSSGCAADDPGVADQSILSFGVADTCFHSLRNDPLAPALTAADYVVVFNLGPGVPNADAYQTGAATGGNKSKIVTAAASAAPNEDEFHIAANNFAYRSPGNRFQIIDGPVVYQCNVAAGTLTRYWGFPIQSAFPPSLVGASSALIATNLSPASGCSFSYTNSIANANAGAVTINLQFKDARGGVVTLLQEAHVNNAP